MSRTGRPVTRTVVLAPGPRAGIMSAFITVPHAARVLAQVAERGDARRAYAKLSRVMIVRALRGRTVVPWVPDAMVELFKAYVEVLARTAEELHG